MKLVVLERNSVGTDIDVSCFEKFGEVTYYPNTVADNTAERIKDADIVIANKVPLNESTLKDAPNVKLICLFATGYDNVDLAYCKNRGIKVANVINYCTPAVAQHTILLAMMLSEKIAFYDEYVKSGTYSAQDRFSNFDRAFNELEGKTWGIVGMGSIGHKVAAFATAFGCKVIFYSASGKSTCTEYERVDFDTLLKESDILSLHCPLSDRTRNLINKDAFAKMKETAILVNVARGPVVNTQDLYDALTEGKIAGAGLDVLEKEPMEASNPLGQIKDSTKLIITPHMSWASTESRIRLVEEVAKNIEAFLAGEDRNIVNK
ncbi:MAG: D-2-hydroxyacid dehydrogenase [Lachnospiraceae bacterium]|nr:D-2-hydroxyacid dehydrogenase [Lachnospiraceae bacterium]MDD6810687.1 D-2-hydroxyacid dehydrogenase [Lachnospiraceae bacterium]